ncbi:MAG: PEP-CTERM sorting domain-containing protein [Phycisphaeraceae bacterium]|nr:PEP-CTERM sorting domain-containing protein [Phycisphaeraceae bacterium]HRJ49084.1 PEP-CTERM sorting domain-containing protein [Phycisphaerales bacterium]
MKLFVSLAALALAAGMASAKDPVNGELLTGLNSGGTSPGGYTTRDLLVIDVSGILSMDGFGDPDNVVQNYNIGANSHVTGIGWNVTLFADSPSWLSEMSVAFQNSAQNAGVFLTPGVGDNISGTKSYSSGGIVDLVGLGLDFNVDANGLLRVEFFEGFVDYNNDWDGIWQSGALTIEYVVPAPGTAALLATAGLVALRRRR